jgi:chemotaxis family two-component system sensor kinase Cph1
LLRHHRSQPEIPRVSSEAKQRAIETARDPRLPAELASALDQHAIVACADRAGLITFVNPACCRVSGYTREELIGKGHDILRAEHHEGEPVRALWQKLAQGESWRGELQLRAKDGAEHWVAASVSPLAGSTREASHYVAVCIDITQNKLATLAELERQRSMLAHCNEELEQYAYVASHDLQEPLRAIVGCGQLLREEYATGTHDDTARQLLDHMIEGGQRMQRLVLALLAYSRLGTREPRRVRISSRDALDQALRLLGTAIEEAGATIEARDLPAVSSDPEQIVQLFQNLLENAIKFHGTERPVIRVDATRDGDFWRFSITDNGIGIDRQYFQRIFVLFQRLHARNKYPGTGVGLTLCKKIVEGHGGRIWVDSEHSRGATFHFTLPAHRTLGAEEA